MELAGSVNAGVHTCAAGYAVCTVDRYPALVSVNIDGRTCAHSRTDIDTFVAAYAFFVGIYK